MNEDRTVGLVLLLILLPGIAGLVRDWREGRTRLVFSGKRRDAAVERASDPRRFLHFLLFNALVYLAVAAGALFLLMKPQG